MNRRVALTLFTLLALLLPVRATAQAQNELRFCLRSDPKTFQPHLVDDDASETIRYLTGGVLIRVNRQTQAFEPELAVSWKVLEGGRKISFRLRPNLVFSDGTPFSSEDVAHTMRVLMDPAAHSPTGDSFRSGEGEVRTQVSGKHALTISFPAPIAGLERLFDQVAIVSARSTQKEMAVLGPFQVAEHKPGVSVLLRRNPQYWKRDSAGWRLPYLDSIRLDIQQNREIEMLRFRRGEIHLVNNLDPELFDRLAAEAPGMARDAGPSMESEQMWFNQAAAAPLPAHKLAWFRSRNFRRAVSEAINRQDLVRVAFRSRAAPATGPVSAANQFWFNRALKPHPYDPQAALRRLATEGFRLDSGVLRDAQGNAVEFSLVTNAGNKVRERMGAMIQQDLAQIGIKLNVVTLDFGSLIERMTRTFDYEACLLGLVNVDLDPNGQMNVWLSSSSNHQWNPNQKTPATPWEAEIDRLMQAQASALDARKRKTHFDRVQQIVWEEAPFIYLVTKHSLSAVSDRVANAAPVVLRPQTYWNAERLQLTALPSGSR